MILYPVKTDQQCTAVIITYLGEQLLLLLSYFCCYWNVRKHHLKCVVGCRIGYLKIILHFLHFILTLGSPMGVLK